MTRLALAAFILLLSVIPISGQSETRRPTRETWYEWALGRINSENIDYGAMWEDRKREFIDRLSDPHAQFDLAAVAAVALLLTVAGVQRGSHRRALDVAARSIADVLRHDAYARKIGREAIDRYNAHIESCNRMIEAAESGLWKWMSSAELDAMKTEMTRTAAELADANKEIQVLKQTLQEKSAMVADLSMRSESTRQKGGEAASSSVPPAHIERINQLEMELNAEKKKNQRLKGTALNVRHR